MKYLAALVLVALALSAQAEAQELSLHLSRDSVTVGERFYLSVVARHDFAADPAFPDPASDDSLVFGDLEVLRLHARDRRREGESRVDSVVYEVTTFALDTARVAPIPVLFTAGEDTFTVVTPAAMVAVVPLVPENAEDIRDIAPIVEFPMPIWPYVAGALALLALAAVLAFYIRSRRRRAPVAPPAEPAPPAPPHVEALQRLRNLEQVDLSRRDAIKPFYVEVSDILRHYLARRVHVTAMEVTTGELLTDLQQLGRIPSDLIERLRGVLSLSDFVKFADAEPPPEQGRQALRESRDFVQDLEHALREPTPEHA